MSYDDEVRFWDEKFSSKHEEGDIKGVGWNSQDALLIRYYEILKHLSSGERILDVGCGYGLLYKFLTCVPGFDASNYTGTDIQEKLINFCRKKYPEVSWEVRTFLDGVEEKFDSMVFCGALARTSVPEVTEIVKRGLELSDKLIISFCCHKAPVHTEGIWFPKISEMVSAIEDLDGVKFEIYHGYLDHDVLFVIYT